MGMITDTLVLFKSCMGIVFKSDPDAFVKLSGCHHPALMFNFLDFQEIFPAGHPYGFNILLDGGNMSGHRQKFFTVCKNTGFPYNYFFSVQIAECAAVWPGGSTNEPANGFCSFIPVDLAIFRQTRVATQTMNGTLYFNRVGPDEHLVQGFFIEERNVQFCLFQDSGNIRILSNWN